MIATAALAGYLLAEADFSRSGRRKMAGSVLDNGGCCSTRRQLARKSRFFAAKSAHGRRKVGGIIRSVAREMKFYRLNSRARPARAAVNLLVVMKFIVQI